MPFIFHNEHCNTYSHYGFEFVGKEFGNYACVVITKQCLN